MVRGDKVYLAVDLGASNGRVVAGLFDGRRLALEEVYRFDNGGVVAAGRMYWDVLRLWGDLVAGLRAAAARYGARVASVGVDTWGVDFALLGRGDELLANPLHYRDLRITDILERAFAIVPRDEIFAESGLQFMEFNSLYQLLAMKLAGSPVLDAAESMLLMPDLFHWLLTGEKSNEVTDASTTQFYNPRTRDWSRGLLERFGLPTNILGKLTPPGTRLGRLRKSVAEETGLSDAEVVLPGTHDTASAVMAVPVDVGATAESGMQNRPQKGGQALFASQTRQSEPVPDGFAKPAWCYISSGTWSLMGVEVPEPVINDTCYRLNFTNEGGVGGTTRLLKNIAGMWLVQECRRIWQQAGRTFEWDELVSLAERSPPHGPLINPDDARFVAPRDMPAAIVEFLRESEQSAPQSEGAFVRCAYESIALRYRMVLTWLEQLVEGPIDTIHIVGGGAHNRLLCQMAADATGRCVVAGPTEATAIGNLMMQAVAAGDVGSIAEARQVIRDSFDVQSYEPRGTTAWDESYGRFQKLLGD